MAASHGNKPKGLFSTAVFLGKVRKHERRRWKFIQMAAEVDLSLPFDRCGSGACDLKVSEKQNVCAGEERLIKKERKMTRLALFIIDTSVAATGENHLVMNVIIIAENEKTSGK